MEYKPEYSYHPSFLFSKREDPILSYCLNQYSGQPYVSFVINPKQRRLDSLARILSPHRSIAKSIAVAIINDTLIIGANIPKKIDSTQLFDFLLERRAILQEFLADNINDREAIERLKMAGGLNSIFRKFQDRITRDLLKIKQSNQTLFTLPSSVVILIPDLPESRHLIPSIDQLQQLYKEQLATIPHTDIEQRKYWEERMEKTNSQNNLLRRIHAEQLVAKYIRVTLGITDPIYIGNNKLACWSCHTVLTEANFGYRGTHGGIYPIFELYSHYPRFRPRDDEYSLGDQEPENSDSEPENSSADTVPISTITPPTLSLEEAIAKSQQATATIFQEGKMMEAYYNLILQENPSHENKYPSATAEPTQLDDQYTTHRMQF